MFDGLINIPKSEIQELFERFYYQFSAYDLPDDIKERINKLSIEIKITKIRLSNNSLDDEERSRLLLKLQGLQNQKITKVLLHIFQEMTNVPEEMILDILSKCENFGLVFGKGGAIKPDKHKALYIKKFMKRLKAPARANIDDADEEEWVDGTEYSLTINPDEFYHRLGRLNYGYFHQLREIAESTKNSSTLTELNIEPSNKTQIEFQAITYISRFLRDANEFFRLYSASPEDEGVEILILGLTAHYMAAVAQILDLFWDEAELVMESVLSLGLDIDKDSLILFRKRLAEHHLEFTPSDVLVITEEDELKHGLYYLGLDDIEPSMETILDLLHEVLHSGDDLSYLYATLGVADEEEMSEYINCLRRYAIFRELQFVDSEGHRVSLKDLRPSSTDDGDNLDPNEEF